MQLTLCCTVFVLLATQEISQNSFLHKVEEEKKWCKIKMSCRKIIAKKTFNNPNEGLPDHCPCQLSALIFSIFRIVTFLLSDCQQNKLHPSLALMQPPLCSHHSVVPLNVPPTALCDWLHVTSYSLSTLRACLTQSGKEEHIQTEQGCVSR